MLGLFKDIIKMWVTQKSKGRIKKENTVHPHYLDIVILWSCLFTHTKKIIIPKPLFFYHSWSCGYRVTKILSCSLWTISTWGGIRQCFTFLFLFSYFKQGRTRQCFAFLFLFLYFKQISFLWSLVQLFFIFVLFISNLIFKMFYQRSAELLSVFLNRGLMNLREEIHWISFVQAWVRVLLATNPMLMNQQYISTKVI